MAAPSIPGDFTSPAPDRFTWWRTWAVARTDLRQLLESKDFWVPMALLGSFFFVMVPAFLLILINGIGNVGAVQQVSQALQLLPQQAQAAVPAGADPSAKVQYVLAVYL